MIFDKRIKFITVFCFAACFAAYATAADDGQEDLDKATEAKFSAKTLTDLSEVIRLTESALQKGLDESNTKFADNLLVSALVQRATFVSATILKSSFADQRWQQFRQYALSDLDKALKLEPKQPQALIIVAQLNMLPEGDQKRAKEAIDQAVEYSADDPEMRAKSLVLRAAMQDTLEKRMPDLDEAVKLAPKDPEIVRNRALVLADLKRYDEALADLDTAIEIEPENASSFELKSAIFSQMKKYDEALDALEQAQKLSPNSIAPWLQKTRIHALQKKVDDAIEDLNRAAALDPINVSILLLRCSLYLEKGDKEKALADAKEAVNLRPKYSVALRTLAAILADMGKTDEALAQLEKVLKFDPDDPISALQIGMIYTVKKQSRKAIEVYSKFLNAHPDEAKNPPADTDASKDIGLGIANILRARGDAYLNIGMQVEAAADYERAYRDMSKDSSLLNNFAWLLATSTDEKLRDGDRALKMAMESCELTEYKQAHIVSTLAAAYAETGDFDSALKWAEKAAELGDAAHADEYKKEVDTYKEHKPFREILSENESAGDSEKSPDAANKSENDETKTDQKEEKSDTVEKSAEKNEAALKTITPFNGKNLNGWSFKQSKNRSKWTVGTAQTDPQNPKGLILTFAGQGPSELVNLESKGVDIYSNAKFGDCTIDLEFMVPKDSNSGVYVMGEYEIQIFDSYGKKDITYSDLGAIYGAAVPKVNASKAPSEWQSLNVEFKAPRFDGDNKTSNARFVKITLNGQVIHENVEMKGPTPGGLTGKESPEGPIMFQGDHGPVSYRNIKITVPVAKEK